MWLGLILGGVLVLGLVVARWWLLPLPFAALLVINATASVPQDDDISGIGRFILFIISTVVLVVGIAVGRLARQPGEPPESQRRSD